MDCTALTDLDLARAYRASAFPALGVSFERAKADPILARSLHGLACSQRRLLRDCARQAERARAGRWLERSALDDYELTDKHAHLGEMPA